MLKAGSHLSPGLEALLLAQIGIRQVTVNTGCHSVTIVYDPTEWSPESLRKFVQSRGREELEQYASVALEDDVTNQSPVNWLQPWRFLDTTADHVFIRGSGSDRRFSEVRLLEGGIRLHGCGSSARTRAAGPGHTPPDPI